MTNSRDSQPAKNNFKRASILVIDDNDDNWHIIEQAIAGAMPEVVAIRVANLEEVRTLFATWRTNEWEMPRLILLDLYLPDRHTGWQALDLIREMPAPCNQVPVVLLSYSDASADINEAYQRGVSSYLVKPVEFSAWQDYFRQLRTYWWETVTLPPMQLFW